MKKVILTIILTGVLSSCSKNFNVVQHTQKWQLVKMSGSMAGSEATGSDMEWQEFYVLKPDGTFKKSRQRQGTLTEAGGTYRFKDLPDGKYLELVYGSENGLIGNCSSEPKELLLFHSENKLVGTWQACDGPGLEYEVVK